MSIKSNNTLEKRLLVNEEACILREIFNIIEAKKENKEIEIKNSPIIEKYNIKNIKLVSIESIDTRPKNRYRAKLQKIFSKKFCNHNI